MPPAIAARPRDARGYPVLAITPWRGGVPDFAVTSPARILVCAVERRCSICGLPLGKGPVWRVVAADEAAVIAAEPGHVENAAGTVEPPGHRSCMLYAAVVCPWLARPNARRRLDAEGAGLHVPRGEARGAVGEIGGAVVAFDTYEFTVGERVEFRYRGLVDFLPHLLGEEHVQALRDAPHREVEPVEACPPWLLSDETAAQERALRYQ
ncbi:MAG TPA: hypothetical protein VGK78_06445 [Nocardioides sp.]|uniref:hypothetical protein n=1 Tax=Nocardioides sp. TaxID=35761 RepID=UPI002F4203B8